MGLSVEEKLMYEVMHALYDSGIPISFKGSMVLKACLLEAGYTEETRHTVDIDANWYADVPPSDEMIRASLQEVIDNNHLDLIVGVFRPHGTGRSAGLELMTRTAGERLFTMDIDIDRPDIPTKVYAVQGIQFRGAAPIQMIADKVLVVSTDKIFRRIKDLIDLYYLSKVFPFNAAEVIRALQNSRRSIGSFDGFLHRGDELEHAYVKFRFEGGVKKPAFKEVYGSVMSYIEDVLPDR